MARTKTDKFSANDTEGKVVRVFNHGADGYRRGGVKHPKGKAEYQPGKFSAAQIAQLQDDPKISVEIADAPVQEAAHED